MALTKVIGDGLATSGLPAGTVIQVVSTTSVAMATVQLLYLMTIQYLKKLKVLNF